MTKVRSTACREHGGDIDVARQRHCRNDMIDLSTGISPRSYPAPPLTADRLQALPMRSDLAACLAAARRHYQVPDELALCAGPGTQALLQLVPALASDGAVWIAQPTYNEHLPAWSAHGHDVSVAPTLPEEVRHAVVVLPNNPTGWADYTAVATLAAEIGRREGLLLIDGAFADGATHAEDVHLLAELVQPHVLHLRSFGKFFGMAGLRLGFAIGQPEQIDYLADRIGPWAVGTAALEIGKQALDDEAWVTDHRIWLSQQADNLSALLIRHGLTIIGGTSLFQCVRCDHAATLQRHLGENSVWVRAFSAHPDLLRIGLPGDAAAFSALDEALAKWTGKS